VFLTGSHDDASTDAIWLVKRYVPEKWFIQFYRVEPEDKIGVVTVQCSRITDHVTHVEVTYQYIPLSEKGRRFINGFTMEIYKKFIDEWRGLLLRYFESAASYSSVKEKKKPEVFNMISRIWHGWTSPSNADAYESLLKSEIFVGIKDRHIVGYRAFSFFGAM